MSLYLGSNKVKLRNQSAIKYGIVGSPTITSDGVASGFTDKTDYLTLGAFNPGTNKWAFTTKVKFNSLSVNMSLIDRNSSTRCFQIAMRTNGKWRANISINGSSKANEVDGSHVWAVNTIYYLRFEYDGSKYYLKVSTDNINWTTDITINRSDKIYPVSTMCMGHSWYSSGSEKWDGEIYLRETHLFVEGADSDTWKLHVDEHIGENDYIIVDGELVWVNPNMYLQCSGTQWIDTGFIPNKDTRVVTEINYTSLNAGQFLFCARKNTTQQTYSITIPGDSITHLRTDYGNERITITDLTLVTDNWYVIDKNKNLTYIDDTLLATQTYTNFDPIITLSLFCGRRSDAMTPIELMSGKMKYLQIYDNGTLALNLVPVPVGLEIGNYIVPSNGMFDMVNQQFYPNQGTGTFEVGKVI